MAEPGKILVVGYAAIGDLIFFLPVVQELRRRFPKARLVWLANDYPTTRELLPATGLVDEFWLHDWESARGQAEQRAIERKIEAEGFDMAVLTQAAPAHFFYGGLKTIPVIAGHTRGFERAPLAKRFKRWVATGELHRRLLVNRRAWCGLEAEHSVPRNLRLLEALGLPGPFGDRPMIPLTDAARARAEKELPGGPWIGVHVAGVDNQYGKIWPPERFGAACAELAKTAKARFALFAAPDESSLKAAAAAKAAFPGFVDLSGRLTLLETFAAIARCALFFASDAGPAKAAMALGVPTATIFGPVDPAEFGAYWDREKHLDIRTGIACSPCARLGMALEDRLNFRTCGHRDCIGRLDAAFAVTALRGRYQDLFAARG